MLKLFLLVAVVLQSSQSTPPPVIIKTGIVKNHHEQDEHSFHDGQKSAGLSNQQHGAGFNKESENKQIKADDEGSYAKEDSSKRVNTDQGGFADSKYHRHEGGQALDAGRQNAHKKGHHKSGFTKSYRKDETEDNSSYYDDGADAGHEYEQNVRRGDYGDAGQEGRRRQHLDDRRASGDGARRGYYGNSGNYENSLANDRQYQDRRYYDNRDDQGRRGGASRYDENERIVDEKFVGGAHYQPRQTITIYEDPRYVDNIDQYRSYQRPNYDRYIQLDVKRPPRDYLDYRYHYRRPLDNYRYY